MNTSPENSPPPVPARATQGGEPGARKVLAELAVWTERMLTALVTGLKGKRWFSLIDKVYRAETLRLAWEKVQSNAGGSGVDGITVGRFAKDCPHGLLVLNEQLRQATYQPKPVKRVWIPKPGSSEKRPLGIPTVCSNCTPDQRVFGMGRYHPSVPPTAKPEITYLEIKDVLGPAHADFGGRGMRHVFGFAGVD